MIVRRSHTMSANNNKKSVCQSHPRFCGALIKDSLTKFFSMCLSIRADVAAFVKPQNNIFLLSLLSFLLRKKKSKIFGFCCCYLVKCFRNDLRYLTCFYAVLPYCVIAKTTYPDYLLCYLLW